MATRAAHKRLTKEYKNITENPPPYITAHPSESNILEWHYILEGPKDTPYAGGQYWGTLVFPPDYPFAPPAIRMHTPSGRFQPSTRLCLSISDFHPKSFNPAWEVSTILLGLQSFMTSEEMTTGSLSATAAERIVFATRSKWWNSTGGGSSNRTIPAVSTQPSSNTRGFGAIRAGDGGVKFKEEWPELDEENWKWMEEHKIDPQTGKAVVVPPPAANTACSPETNALRKRPVGSHPGLGAVVEGGHVARDAGQSWLRRNRMYVALGLIFGYVVLARALGEPAS
ncbi:ubiquitin-protein ligase [Aureobasidium pullulans]|nr:ubiquitin-protein ligase [Aureobasidium pullulans]THX72401.1 ubiquitin-protein ligase [Aureobasidium pullulans]